MDYKEKLAFLRRYQASLKAERAMLLEIEQLRAEAERVTPALSGMPRGPGDGQAMPRAVERIVETRIKLDAQIQAGKDVRNEIEVVIQTARTPMQRDILYRRYILGQRWERIAADLDRDLRWVMHVHHDAVEGLKL
jgi:hypothetical protein